MTTVTICALVLVHVRVVGVNPTQGSEFSMEKELTWES